MIRFGTGSAVLWVFLAAGLLVNVQPMSAANLTLVLTIAYLGSRRLSSGAWVMAALGWVCWAGAASPYIWHIYAAEAAHGGLAGPPADWSAVTLAFQYGELTVLYPEMLADALWFLAFTLVLWGPAIIVMAWTHQFHARHLRTWVWMLAGALGVGLALHGASQLVGIWRGSPPPVVDFVHALRLVMLPLYVLFGQAVVHVLRIRPWRNAFRVILGVLLAAWLVPAANMGVARHWVEDAYAARMAEDDRPQSVQTRQVRRQRDAEVAASPIGCARTRRPRRWWSARRRPCGCGRAGRWWPAPATCATSST